MIADLNDHFTRLAPEDNKLYRHTVEGPDDMPAHIRAALTATQLSIPALDVRFSGFNCLRGLLWTTPIGDYLIFLEAA